MSALLNAQTRLCAVIGNPVGHSLSPQIHNAAYAATGANFAYVAFRVEDLGGCLAGLRALEGFRGLSVTIPHKEAIIPLLDEVEPLARRVGSVNTVTNEGGRLIGATTDGPGTLRAFREAGVPLEGKRVLFLGTGGAVRAVAFAMADEGGVAQVTLCGRTPERVERLAGDLRAAGASCPVQTAGLDSGIESAIEAHDIIVNGTPLGMYPEHVGKSIVPSGMLAARHVVFDMVYRPERTRLVEEAEAAGATVIGGLDMLVYQAVLQFERWTGQPGPADAMFAAARAALRGA
ncbi:MAG: shikimate dehydrogenase [Candidatus Hydrogenedens sp.]|nr:shikimate dehydrogenase [Candidatus Hydrogenedens sp.]